MASGTKGFQLIHNVIIEKLLVSRQYQISLHDAHTTHTHSSQGALEASAAKCVFAGMIDQFYLYKLVELEYRSLRFEHEILDQENYQEGNT